MLDTKHKGSSECEIIRIKSSKIETQYFDLNTRYLINITVLMAKKQQ
jgi:hypothetical protein